MSDTKVSALTAASKPIGGALQLHLADGSGGADFRVRADDLVQSQAGALFHPGFVAGRYYGMQPQAAAVALRTALRFYACPIPIPYRCTISHLVFRATTSGGTVRAGLYANSGARAGGRLRQTASLSLGGALNVAALASSVTVDPGWYWAGVVFSASASIMGFAQNSFAGGGIGWTFGGAVSGGGDGDIYSTSGSHNAVYRTAALANTTNDLPDPFIDGSSFTFVNTGTAGSPIIWVGVE